MGMVTTVVFLEGFLEARRGSGVLTRRNVMCLTIEDILYLAVLV